MATYNGASYIREQLNSILNQANVDVGISVFDDCSTDLTREIIADYNFRDGRVKLQGWSNASGGSFENFRRAVLELANPESDYIAFADQDDVWVQGKLQRQIEVIRSTGSAGCSSSVNAFYEDVNTRCRYVNNVGKQQRFDFLFEGGGQGCTYVFTRQTYLDFRAALMRLRSANVLVVVPHDWLLYALCRNGKKKWLILPDATVEYRQHLQNVMGARGGWRGKLHRLKMLRSGVFKTMRVNICIAVEHAFPGSLPKILLSQDAILRDRLFFAGSNLLKFRRFKIHSLIMALMFVMNIA